MARFRNARLTKSGIITMSKNETVFQLCIAIGFITVFFVVYRIADLYVDNNILKWVVSIVASFAITMIGVILFFWYIFIRK
jgi:hypothetical protein